MLSNFSTLTDRDVRGKRVLLRLDVDEPLENGVLQSVYRIDRAKKTIEFLQTQKAKTLIIGHIGRDPKETLRPVFEYLKRSFSVEFVSTIEEAKQRMVSLKDGGLLLLENLRQYPGETANDVAFAKELASLADLYVNEAFAVSHREHASIVGVPKFLPSFAGFVFSDEVLHLSKAFSLLHPALVILGGAKFETKTPLIERFLDTADHVYVCGALSNDIFHARGYGVGTSLISKCEISEKLLGSPKLHVPSDVIVHTATGPVEKGVDTVADDERTVDVGSESLSDLRVLIEKAAFVLWNGPVGEYENGFDQGTIMLAQMLAECDAETIIGGGDSIVMVSKLGLMERFTFVSTGGGAMLEFLAKETLPGIEALKARN